MTRSTLARRTLGRRLRRLRDAAHVSQGAAARAAELSSQSIGRLEIGQATRVSSLHINVLCDVYKVGDTERRLLLSLAQEARHSAKSGGGQWRAVADEIAEEFDYSVELEGAAETLTMYQSTVVPGLLQTADYARAGIWTMRPQLPGDDVGRTVERLLRRQERLRDSNFRMVTFLSEAVLHHCVGGAAVLERQAMHLAAIGAEANVSIRLVPHSAGNHMGLYTGPFALFEFAKSEPYGAVDPPVIHVAGFTGQLYLERESEINQYRTVLADLERVALDERASRDRMIQLTRDR